MEQLRPPCPCGGHPDPGTPYDGCCGRLHRGAAAARTAEELMRSRHAAFAVGGRTGEDHLFRTWHPRTRPADTAPDPGTTWTGLEILATEAGGVDDVDGVVEFRAHHVSAGRAGTLHERSTFTRRAGRWVYVDGRLG